MSKMIVITGLDGSGKSTLLEKLENQFKSQVAILRLPTMDSEKFSNSPTLFQCCEMINELGKKADTEAEPSLKILSMFSAVVLFNDLFNQLETQKFQFIICERHPLVDTLIYAKAYLAVMHPSNLSAIKAEIIDRDYDFLFQEVGKRLAIDFSPNTFKSHGILAFLHDWFSEKENLIPQKLTDLFHIKKAEKIYFLDAPAAVLFKRIQNRNEKEFHENIIALEKMRTNYLALLPQLGSTIEIIDASDNQNPNDLFELIAGRYFKDPQ